MRDLLDNPDTSQPQHDELAPGAMVLHGQALAMMEKIVAALHNVVTAASFRHMVTPGGSRCPWR